MGMVICPRCGMYQENTKGERKFGLALKNTAKFLTRHAIKLTAKAAASAVGLDGDMVQLGVGNGVNKMLEETSLGKTESLNSVQYLCDKCGTYWDGYDKAGRFNDVQKNTIKSLWEDEVKRLHDKYYAGYLQLGLNALWYVLCYWLWISREFSVTTKTAWLVGTYQDETYSWHYYIFWPVLIVTVIFTLIILNRLNDAYSDYHEIKDMDIETYGERAFSRDVRQS